MQPLRVVVSADRTGDEMYQHDGEEWLYVLSGSLRLSVGGETLHLNPGDAAHFDARAPHRLAAGGEADVELILVACAAPRSLLDSYL
jgi:quercetin dioxygenase-like cupin family protein